MQVNSQAPGQTPSGWVGGRANTKVGGDTKAEFRCRQGEKSFQHLLPCLPGVGCPESAEALKATELGVDTCAEIQHSYLSLQVFTGRSEGRETPKATPLHAIWAKEAATAEICSDPCPHNYPPPRTKTLSAGARSRPLCFVF